MSREVLILLDGVTTSLNAFSPGGAWGVLHDATRFIFYLIICIIVVFCLVNVFCSGLICHGAFLDAGCLDRVSPTFHISAQNDQGPAAFYQQ